MVKKENHPEPTRESKLCPECGMSNTAEILVNCMYCGHVFKDATAEKLPVPEPILDEPEEEIDPIVAVKCSTCNKYDHISFMKVIENLNYCTECQEKLPKEPKQEQEESNVVDINEAKSKKVEIITSTKEEKQMLERTKQIDKHIEILNQDNTKLDEKATYYEHLTQTLKFEPFVDLKKLVSEALHEKVDNQNIKELKSETKNFEAIDNIEGLLKHYKSLASSYRYDIQKNNKQISELYDEQSEINEKLNRFQYKLF